MYSLKDKRWFYTPTENTIAITDNKGNRSVYDTNNNPDYTDIVAEHLYQTFEDSTSENAGREGIGDYEWECKETKNRVPGGAKNALDWITWKVTDGESYLTITLYLDSLADGIDTADIKDIMADVLNYPEPYLRD